MPKKRRKKLDLDILATFQRRRSVSDYGPEVDEWVDAFEEWVGYNPLSTRNRVVASQVEEGQTGTLTVHYRDDIDATMRCVDERGKIYEFKGEPIDDGDHQEFLLIDVAVSTNRTTLQRFVQ